VGLLDFYIPVALNKMAPGFGPITGTLSIGGVALEIAALVYHIYEKEVGCTK